MVTARELRSLDEALTGMASARRTIAEILRDPTVAATLDTAGRVRLPHPLPVFPTPFRSTDLTRSPDPTPLTDESLAVELEARIRSGDSTIAALACEYRPQLIELGHLRSDSLDKTALHRLQDFLRKHVYRLRIPEAELPERIRRGRQTGAIGHGSRTARS